MLIEASKDVTATQNILTGDMGPRTSRSAPRWR
jgi:hypothetical protein